MSHCTAVVSALIAGALLSGTAQEPSWELAKPAPSVALKPPRVGGLEEYACATCHAEVAEEWADTAHAIAWIDELYHKELEGRRRPETCHGCHAPEPLHLFDLADRPDARDGERHLGISCESCHLGPEGVMLGPRGTPTDAHPSRQSPTLTGAGSTELCSACHRVNVGPVIGVAKDFESSKQAERGRSCVGCHMAPVERQWATAPGAAEQPPARVGRSHALQTPRDPAFLRRAFAASLRVEGGTSIVALANQAGHRVPGLIGRSIEFEARALGPGGEELARAELTLDARSYLPVDDKVELELGAAASEVHLVGRHRDPRASEPTVFLDERLKAR